MQEKMGQRKRKSRTGALLFGPRVLRRWKIKVVGPKILRAHIRHYARRSPLAVPGRRLFVLFPLHGRYYFIFCSYIFWTASFIFFTADSLKKKDINKEMRFMAGRVCLFFFFLILGAAAEMGPQQQQQEK